MEAKWLGVIPKKCDCCGRAITDKFVDGRTKLGPWSLMCLDCHDKIGVGLGLGKGQLYALGDQGWDLVKAEKKANS